MSNTFLGTGNLKDSPTIKTVKVNGEERKVAELRIFFDDYKRNAAGEFEQVGGFWLNCSIWDARAEAAAKLLRKGARVRVEGRLTQQSWVDKETGEEKTALQLYAEDVFPSLSRIEEIRFREKQQGGGEDGPAASDASGAGSRRQKKTK
jgi:single-strand DNA-binding protein